jgi:hypothetical protein
VIVKRLIAEDDGAVAMDGMSNVIVECVGLWLSALVVLDSVPCSIDARILYSAHNVVDNLKVDTFVRHNVSTPNYTGGGVSNCACLNFSPLHSHHPVTIYGNVVGSYNIDAILEELPEVIVYNFDIFGIHNFKTYTKA